MVPAIAELFNERLAPTGGPVDAPDVNGFLRAVVERHGREGLKVALEFVSAIDAAVVASPWKPATDIHVSEPLALKDLFRSEGLTSPDGPLIDQRFVDFLHRNFDSKDRIHWRQFEKLAAEHFRAAGYTVELGPGRNDGGIDLRVWDETGREGQPSVMLVQCKRQKAPVDRGVVKALYTDVLHENAQSGLIVTTSRLSPGADDDRRARAYPIEDADRAAVKRWIERLRRPGAGLA